MPCIGVVADKLYLVSKLKELAAEARYRRSRFKGHCGYSDEMRKWDAGRLVVKQWKCLEEQ